MGSPLPPALPSAVLTFARGDLRAPALQPRERRLSRVHHPPAPRDPHAHLPREVVLGAVDGAALGRHRDGEHVRGARRGGALHLDAVRARAGAEPPARRRRPPSRRGGRQRRTVPPSRTTAAVACSRARPDADRPAGERDGDVVAEVVRLPPPPAIREAAAPVLLGVRAGAVEAERGRRRPRRRRARRPRTGAGASTGSAPGARARRRARRTRAAASRPAPRSRRRRGSRGRGRAAGGPGRPRTRRRRARRSRPGRPAASCSAAQRKKPPGCAASPTKAQRSPLRARFTPHMTIATWPVAACVKRQK